MEDYKEYTKDNLALLLLEANKQLKYLYAKEQECEKQKRIIEGLQSELLKLSDRPHTMTKKEKITEVVKVTDCSNCESIKDDMIELNKRLQDANFFIEKYQKNTVNIELFGEQQANIINIAESFYVSYQSFVDVFIDEYQLFIDSVIYLMKQSNKITSNHLILSESRYTESLIDIHSKLLKTLPPSTHATFAKIFGTIKPKTKKVVQSIANHFDEWKNDQDQLYDYTSNMLMHVKSSSLNDELCKSYIDSHLIMCKREDRGCIIMDKEDYYLKLLRDVDNNIGKNPFWYKRSGKKIKFFRIDTKEGIRCICHKDVKDLVMDLAKSGSWRKTRGDFDIGELTMNNVHEVNVFIQDLKNIEKIIKKVENPSKYYLDSIISS